MVFLRTVRRRLSRYFSFRALVFLGAVTTLAFIYVHYKSYNMGWIKKRSLIFFEAGRKGSDASSSNIQTCIHPRLDINDPVMMGFYLKHPKANCTDGDPNWVYIHNGTIRFSKKAKKIHGAFHCDYFPLIRGPGDYKIQFGKPIRNIQDFDSIQSDFSKIICHDKNKNVYLNIHAGVHRNSTIRERLRTVKPPANGLGLSIAFLGFDSMSRMSWLRRMPKTRDYMVNELDAIELESYNIMGDGTPAALFPILTGKHEKDLPEARRRHKGAKPVDNFPWIWKEFAKNGYVTSWADAKTSIAPFNYRLLGFEHSPTDYFMRPFYLAVDPYYKNYTWGCQRSEENHMVWLNFIREIFTIYKDDPKFLVHFYTPLSHDNNNEITVADDDVRDFISHLHTGGYLNNTMLAVMADHGARFAQVRRTFSGKLEERLPYVSLLFPRWFEEKYPHLIRNLRTNVHRLSTPLDLHETFKDFLKFDGAGMGDTKNKGISLFKEIPKSRSCADADIPFHWCACLDWKNVTISEPDAQRALQTAIESINNFTEPYRSDCALLTIANVTTMLKVPTSSKALNYQRAKGSTALAPGTPNTQIDITMYQMTFFTQPGMGEFEMTIEHLLESDNMTVDPNSISRINMYGDNPACILEKDREIRQYCYCKNTTDV